MPGVLSMKVRNTLFLALILAISLSGLARAGQGAGSSTDQPQILPPANDVQSNDAQSSDAKSDDQPNVGDPLLDVPKLPEGKVSLVGGTVLKIDQIRNRLVVEPFGGGEKLKMTFDERTRVFRDGTETTQMAIHKGDRVYIDTMLDRARVFARNIRVQSQAGPADASGQ